MRDLKLEGHAAAVTREMEALIARARQWEETAIRLKAENAALKGVSASAIMRPPPSAHEYQHIKLRSQEEQHTEFQRHPVQLPSTDLGELRREVTAIVAEVVAAEFEKRAKQ